MANINLYQPGQPANPQSNFRKPKRQYLPESVAAANAVAVILVEKYGQQPWILQCMTAIQEAVQNSVEMLSGSPPVGNGLGLGQGGQYQFAARTAAELQATADQAAVGGSVSPANQRQQVAGEQAEAALASGNVDMFTQLQRAAGLQDPATGQVADTKHEPTTDEWLI